MRWWKRWRLARKIRYTTGLLDWHWDDNGSLPNCLDCYHGIKCAYADAMKARISNLQVERLRA
jgi:hypothetical protein